MRKHLSAIQGGAFNDSNLVENIEAFLRDRPLEHRYDGHANCFIETGFSKALLIDFNYEQEPVGGGRPRYGVEPGHAPERLPKRLPCERRLHDGEDLFCEGSHWLVLILQESDRE